jgi:hypothetical protein
MAVLLVADFAAAHLLLRLRPDLDLTRAERQRLARRRQESSERRYRIESSVYDHDLAKNFDGDAWWGPFHYRVSTNSLGFRDASVRVVPLETTRRRILLLGDSFTEGIGLDYRESYAGIIAERLGRDDVDVLNAGVTSYAPAIYFAKTRYLLEDAALRCSDVVVFIDISDAEDEARFYDLHVDGRVTRMINDHPGHGAEFETAGEFHDPVLPPATLAADGVAVKTIETPPSQAIEERRPDPLRSSLKRHSVIARAVDALAGRGDEVENAAPYPQGNPRRPLWTVDERDYEAFGRTGLELGSRHMDRLLALLRRRGIGLTIAVYPWPEQLRYDTADSIQVRYWRSWASRRGVPFVDLFATMFAAADRDSAIRRFYIPGDVHFNSDGAHRIADAFLEQWRRLGRS